ncbi:hypothetical protein [Phytohabitans suffuscus]|uniref:DUF732 domain-containing protein n=1 Tax=Phytohabitans suffuscus TaxID=624315 RepID=A0A6F8Z1B0_9ACTN|nr:hypothetical protein [Phytohabitans suffuscus]BCB92116.1 hypothetical protein Psuf_094290 [Phytohabitans suffuscus]
MPVIHAPRGLRGAARAAVAVAIAVALLAHVPAPASAARPAAPAADTTATIASRTEIQAAKARLLAAIEPCSTKVPRNDAVALGQCARDLAVPNAERNHDLLDLIGVFLHCLWLVWYYGLDSPYPTVGICMDIHGY